MDIIRISINEAKVGMLIADDIYNSSNQLIFPADARLTEKAITRMRFHSIPYLRIYIEDDSEEKEEAPVITAPADIRFFEKLRETEEFATFNEAFTEVASTIESELNNIVRLKSDTHSETLLTGVRRILDSCRTGIQVFDLLHCTRNYDEIVFAHSLNVALISAVLGRWLSFPEDEISLLIKAAIYHDIGKLVIPQDIVEKAGPLTEHETITMRSHTMRGYNILKNLSLDKRVKLAAMMHHERCDGSGYPLGVKADQIDRFSKIISIADVYEAMTAPRKYRSARCPFAAVKIFESSGLALYDTKYLMTFLEHITQCYIGYRVRLSNGTIGTIVYINRQYYSRPMIQVGNEYLDLSRISGLEIIEIL